MQQKGDPRVYDYDSFKWSRKEYSLSNIADKYAHLMPFVILVTQGYCGRDESTHTIAADELYYVHGIAKQRRVVAKHRGHDKEYYSFPLCYPEKVTPTHAITGEHDKEMSIREMYEAKCYKSFRFPEGSKHCINKNAELENCYMSFGVLDIEDDYDERFLVGHTVLSSPVSAPTNPYGPRYSTKKITEGVHPSFSVIPVYMPIVIAIALDMAEKEFENFHRTMYDFKTYIDKQPHVYDQALEKVGDILLFEELPSHKEYEYILFQTIIESKSKKTDSEQNKKVHVLPDPKSPAPEVPTKGKISKRLSLKKRRSSRAESSEPSSPPALPEKDSPADNGAEYTEIIDLVENFYGNIDSTPLKNRLGPLAMNLDPLRVLEELQHVFMSGKEPKSSLKYDEFGLAIGGKPPPVPPSRRLSLNRAVSNEEVIDPQVPPKIPERTFQRQQSRDSDNDTNTMASPQIALYDDILDEETYDDTLSEKIDVFSDLEDPPQPAPLVMPRKKHNFEEGATALQQFQTTILQQDIVDSSMVPENVSEFSVGDVAKCLELLNMSKHIDAFLKQQIDGLLLMELDEDILKTDLGFGPLNAKKLVRFVKGWRPKLA